MNNENPLRRLGFVGIVIENREQSAAPVNNLLSAFGERIIGRMGVPYQERHCSVITVIVDATTDELGQLTGRLGQLPGVQVKSALTRQES